MPEGLEAEIWRRALESLVGRTVAAVWVDERTADSDLSDVLPGRGIEAVERRGKIVRLAIGEHWLGLHFGMTGRVIVDGRAPIKTLEYSSRRDLPEWDRLRLYTESPNPDPDPNGGPGPGPGPGRGSGARHDAIPALRLNDPRRLGRSSLDAELDHLGVDIFDVTGPVIADAVAGRRAAIKTVLLDQRVVAGLGNLCADEVLFFAGIAPNRSADDVRTSEFGDLADAIRTRLPIMLDAGGSTCGVLDPDRRSGGHPCPHDGTMLRRDTIGGRTAVWCPAHQC